MKYIHYGRTLHAMVAVKGHPFERDALAAMFESYDDISASFVDQPLASLLMHPSAIRAYDVLVLYDMPGLDFLAPAAERPAAVEPPAALREGLTNLLREGKGVLALHHAIAGWPAWPQYAEWLGGRFLYRGGEVRGVLRPDSGYRHAVAYEADAVDRSHPVLQGLPQRLRFDDELYLSEVFEEDVVPLLRARHVFEAGGFHSAEAAVSRGRMHDNAGWSHAAGSDLIAWVKRAEASPLAYLQPGDGAGTYANPVYRQLVGNAIRWLASDAGLRWGRGESDCW